MCWHVKIKIAAHDRIKTFNDSYLNKISGYFQIKGSFPHYEIEHNGCLCDYFQVKKEKIENIMDSIEKIISDNQVKKISVKKYWTEEKKNPDEIKITLSEFVSLEQIKEWKENIEYKIIDHSKFG